MEKEIITPQEVADFTGVTISTVYRWIKSGKLKASNLGQWKIRKEDLEKALDMTEDSQ